MVDASCRPPSNLCLSISGSPDYPFRRAGHRLHKNLLHQAPHPALRNDAIDQPTASTPSTPRKCANK